MCYNNPVKLVSVIHVLQKYLLIKSVLVYFQRIASDTFSYLTKNQNGLYLLITVLIYNIQTKLLREVRLKW